MLEGKYTDAYLGEAGKNAPKFTDEDLKVIASPVDFVGINVYRPSFYVLASEQAPIAVLDLARRVRVGVPDRRAFAVLVPCAFDLVRRSGRAPEESGREPSRRRRLSLAARLR
jgi:hypothetical protein